MLDVMVSNISSWGVWIASCPLGVVHKVLLFLSDLRGFRYEGLWNKKHTVSGGVIQNTGISILKLYMVSCSISNSPKVLGSSLKYKAISINSWQMKSRGAHEGKQAFKFVLSLADGILFYLQFWRIFYTILDALYWRDIVTGSMGSARR